MAAIPKRGVPFPDLLRVTATRVVPAGFVLGAAMELFMYATGFWGVATRKEAERRLEARDALRAGSSSGTGGDDRGRVR